jgi:hypothetical protein
VFPVFFPPLRDGRSYCGGGGGGGGERVKLTDGLRVRVMAHDEPIRFEANTLVVPAHNKKHQLEFDSIVFGIQGEGNYYRKAHAYKNVKIEFPANETLLEIVASKLLSVLKFHFEHLTTAVDQGTGEEDEDEELKSIFLNVFIF